MGALKANPHWILRTRKFRLRGDKRSPSGQRRITRKKSETKLPNWGEPARNNLQDFLQAVIPRLGEPIRRFCLRGSTCNQTLAGVRKEEKQERRGRSACPNLSK